MTLVKFIFKLRKVFPDMSISDGLAFLKRRNLVVPWAHSRGRGNTLGPGSQPAITYYAMQADELIEAGRVIRTPFTDVL